jgi:hypothetical protein
MIVMGIYRIVLLYPLDDIITTQPYEINDTNTQQNPINSLLYDNLCNRIYNISTTLIYIPVNTH